MDVEIYAWLSDLYFMIEIGDYNGAFQKMSSLSVYDANLLSKKYIYMGLYMSMLFEALRQNLYVNGTVSYLMDTSEFRKQLHIAGFPTPVRPATSARNILNAAVMEHLQKNIRGKNHKKIVLSIHPDKNPTKKNISTELFKYYQEHVKKNLTT